MKKIGVSIICIVVAVVAYFGYGFWLSHKPDDGSSLQQQLDYLNKQVDLKVLWYGEDVEFPTDFQAIKIQNLDDSNWQKDNDYVFLFVNDLKGRVDFSEEDARKIKEYADTNSNFYFYYIGSDKLDIFKSVYDDCNLDKKDDMSFGYVNYEGEKIQHRGMWSTTDQKAAVDSPDVFCQSIIDTIEMMVRSNEQ